LRPAGTEFNPDVDVVRVEASKVIVFANHRIGEEFGEVAAARRSDFSAIAALYSTP
jgi:hypothetical protein